MMDGTRGIQKSLPWALVLALSTGLAYAMNAAAVGVMVVNPASEALWIAAEVNNNPCALDADGALYDRWDWWLPAGRSSFCRGQTYPGVPGRNEAASQLAGAGRVRATITFEAPNDIRVDLHCLTSSHLRSTDADFVSAAEARALFEDVCTPARSSG